MKVLIAVDASDNAEKTFDWYINNIHKEGNEVFVCHEAVQPDFPTMMFAGAGAFPQEEVHRIVQEHQKKCKQLEQRYSCKCNDHNITNFKIMIDNTACNNPGHGIVKRADEIHADLVVIGSRGLGVIRRTILGSVSDYVVHHSKIPIIVCHHH